MQCALTENSEIRNEIYGPGNADRMWRFCGTCLYWVSWSTLMRMSDQVSSATVNFILLKFTMYLFYRTRGYLKNTLLKNNKRNKKVNEFRQ